MIEYIGYNTYIEVFFNKKQARGGGLKGRDFSLASGSVADVLELSLMWEDEKQRDVVIEYLDDMGIDDYDDSVIVYVYRV